MDGGSLKVRINVETPRTSAGGVRVERWLSIASLAACDRGLSGTLAVHGHLHLLQASMHPPHCISVMFLSLVDTQMVTCSVPVVPA
jgi:hypothetical protein